MNRPLLRALLADITTLHVDVIVNAANTTLLGGDGAIHRGGGPALIEEWRGLGGCPRGAARLTRGYRLPARHVVHAVGPLWRGGHAGEAELPASCYRRAIELAAGVGARSIAFPCIRAGACGCPAREAARVAVASVRFALEDHRIEETIFCCFSGEDLIIDERILAATNPPEDET